MSKNIMSRKTKQVTKENEVFEIDKFVPHKIIKKSKYGFITDHSKDLDVKVINTAEEQINRKENILKIDESIRNIRKSLKIETSIFEFSLLHAFMNNLNTKFIPAIYNDKLNDIMINLDPYNPRIQNKTLKYAIINDEIKPEFIAFMSPEQMHPQRWSEIIVKKKNREEKENNIATTDAYKCRKCGERKCKVSQLQTRSADEPVTTFVTCVVCFNTFTF